MLYISIGILGATVMPHNLYLHSSIVQTRMYGDSFEGKKEAIRYATIDSTVALMSALFINAAILIMAAAVFHPDPQYREVADIGDAYLLLNPLLGATVASTLFAVALLFSGQNATLTGTLAGQIVMEGFLNLRLRPWLRRLITRLIAIVPAVIVIAIKGEEGLGPASGAQPGDSQPAAAVRHLPARPVHEQREADGTVCDRVLGEGAGVAGLPYHCGAERLPAVPDVRSVLRGLTCISTFSSQSSTRRPTKPSSSTSCASRS